MKIITQGKFGKALAANFQISELEIDYVENITQEILNKYQAWAAFSPPPHLDISHIKWIHSFAAGVDPYLSRKDLNPELILTKTVGEMGRKMGEYCLAQILLAAQNCLKLYEKQQAKSWHRLPPRHITNETVAILGTGFMGQEIAQLLGSVNMKTIGINRRGQPANYFQQTFSWQEFTNQPPQISYLISTLPATPDNYHLLDASFFSKFHNLHFINCGRGSVVDSQALLWALAQKNLSLASLDVFEQEPLPQDSDLWNHPKIIITPHQASLTSLDDVIESFQIALPAVLAEKKSPLHVDLQKGY